MDSELEELDILSSWDVFTKTQLGEIPDGSPSDLAFYYRLARCLDAKEVWSNRLEPELYQILKNEMSSFENWAAFMTFSNHERAQNTIGPLCVVEKELLHMKVRSILFDFVQIMLCFSEMPTVLSEADIVELLKQQETHAVIANAVATAHRAEYSQATSTACYDDMFYTLEHDAEDFADSEKYGIGFQPRTPYLRVLQQDSNTDHQMHHEPLSFLNEFDASDRIDMIGFSEVAPAESHSTDQVSIVPSVRPEWISLPPYLSPFYHAMEQILIDLKTDVHHKVTELHFTMTLTYEYIIGIEKKLYMCEYMNRAEFEYDLVSFFNARLIDIQSVDTNFEDDSLALQHRYQMMLDSATSETNQPEYVQPVADGFIDDIFQPIEVQPNNSNDENMLSSSLIQPSSNIPLNEAEQNSNDERWMTYNDEQIMNWKKLTMDKRITMMRTRLKRAYSDVSEHIYVTRDSNDMSRFLETKRVRETTNHEMPNSFFPEFDFISSVVPSLKQALPKTMDFVNIPAFSSCSFIPSNISLIAKIKENCRRFSDEKADEFEQASELFLHSEKISMASDHGTIQSVALRSIMAIFMHHGFSSSQESCLNVVRDILEKYVMKVGKTLRTLSDFYETCEEKWSPEMLFHCLNELGLSGEGDIKDYIWHDLILMNQRLKETEKVSRQRPPRPSLKIEPQIDDSSFDVGREQQKLQVLGQSHTDSPIGVRRELNEMPPLNLEYTPTLQPPSSAALSNMSDLIDRPGFMLDGNPYARRMQHQETPQPTERTTSVPKQTKPRKKAEPKATRKPQPQTSTQIPPPLSS